MEATNRGLTVMEAINMSRLRIYQSVFGVDGQLIGIEIESIWPASGCNDDFVIWKSRCG